MKKPYSGTRKINKTKLNKTLKQIEKKIAVVLKYYIPDTDKEEMKSIMNYLMADIKDIIAENMKSNQKVVYRKYPKRVWDTIADAFQDVDIVKHVCYYSHSNRNYMFMVVVYDGVDESTAYDIVENIISKIHNKLKHLLIELELWHESEAGAEYLKDKTTMFSRMEL